MDKYFTIENVILGSIALIIQYFLDTEGMFKWEMIKNLFYCGTISSQIICHVLNRVDIHYGYFWYFYKDMLYKFNDLQ